MAEQFTAGSRAAEEPGFLGHLSALIAAKLGYLRARLKLAGIEGKEAAIHIGIIAGLAVGGLVAVVFGYFFFIFAAVFLVALAFDSDSAWIWVLFGAAVLHFGGAAALVLIAKSRLAAPLFPLTLGEIQKDQEWLKTHTKQS
jgi:uncharacterized membrane protein YqjE